MRGHAGFSVAVPDRPEKWIWTAIAWQQRWVQIDRDIAPGSDNSTHPTMISCHKQKIRTALSNYSFALDIHRTRYSGLGSDVSNEWYRFIVRISHALWSGNHQIGRISRLDQFFEYGITQSCQSK